VWFHVKARDEIDVIGEGDHQRMVVNTDKFVAKVNEKAKKARVGIIG
jgi:fluoroacetyl-CoA thioesterase